MTISAQVVIDNNKIVLSFEEQEGGRVGISSESIGLDDNARKMLLAGALLQAISQSSFDEAAMNRVITFAQMSMMTEGVK